MQPRLANSFLALEREADTKILPLDNFNQQLMIIIRETAMNNTPPQKDNRNHDKLSPQTKSIIQKLNNMLHASKSWTASEKLTTQDWTN